MMQSEFENLVGFTVSHFVYTNYIEPMYLSLPYNIGKNEFIKMINLEYFKQPFIEKHKYKLDDLVLNYFPKSIHITFGTSCVEIDCTKDSSEIYDKFQNDDVFYECYEDNCLYVAY